MKNGTYKITYPHRLDDLNAIVNPLLPRRELEILDVAVSAGIATLEWIESLDRDGIKYFMTAGDAYLRSWLVSFGKHVHVLVDGSGYPLQYEFMGQVVPNYPTGKRSQIKYFIPKQLLRFAIRISSIGKGGLNAALGVTRRELALVTSRLMNQPGVKVIEDDVLTKRGSVKRYDVIRAANILNICYFDQPTLRAMLINLRKRLVNGGIMVVCRTDENHSNHASVFRLNRGGRFEVIAFLGKGSELQDLVLQLGSEAVHD